MARKDKPSGNEIAQKAKSTKFLFENSTTAEERGKRVKVIPANLRHVKEEELEEGQVIGLLETEIDEQVTGLPPGQHNLFIAKVNDQWQVLAESAGTIVAEGSEVQFEKLPPGRKPDKPRIKFGSIWIRLCVCVYGPGPAPELCWCSSWRFGFAP